MVHLLVFKNTEVYRKTRISIQRHELRLSIGTSLNL